MKKTPADIEELKMEIAEELGLLDKVKKVGWAGLSAKETGRMGGILTRRKRELKNGKRMKNKEKPQSDKLRLTYIFSGYNC